MTRQQLEMYEKKKEELKQIADAIEALPITDEWVGRFTAMSFYRGWRKLNQKNKIMLTNIALIDSPAVAIIVEQTHTKISTEKIERIATVVTDELARDRIKHHLLTRSWKNAKKDIDLIIASYESKVA